MFSAFRVALSMCVPFFVVATVSVAAMAGEVSKPASASTVVPSAKEIPPDEVIKTVTDEVIAIIKQYPKLQSDADRKKLSLLVEAKLEPYFNFAHMTKLAMGRNWRNATPAQQTVLIQEFRTLLLRTYSVVLLSYEDNAPEFKPSRMAPGDTDVMVRMEVKRSGGQVIAIDFSTEKTASGWKAYDIIVDSMSLITTHRSSFASVVRDSGIDGLIKQLAEKNRPSVQKGQPKK